MHVGRGGEEAVKELFSAGVLREWNGIQPQILIHAR